MHPSDIRIGQNKLTSLELFHEIKTGRLSLDFNKTWDNENMSMSIESILLGLTMTPIYIDASNSETWYVLDGKKRLVALKKFFNNEFKLSGLEFYPNFNNKRFEDLSFKFQKKLEEALFTVHMINKGVPNDVRFSLMLRIVPDLKGALTQEYRESFLEPKTREFLNKMIQVTDYEYLLMKIRKESDFVLPLHFIRYYLFFTKPDFIKEYSYMEHVIFHINSLSRSEENSENMNTLLEAWSIGIRRIVKLWSLKSDRENQGKYLNKLSIPFLLFLFGQKVDELKYQSFANNKETFLNIWNSYYIKEGKNELRRVFPQYGNHPFIKTVMSKI